MIDDLKMPGEYAQATIHFFEGGLYVECEDLDIGKFIPVGNGNALMDIINEIDDIMNPDSRFSITEKGEEALKQMNNDLV